MNMNKTAILRNGTLFLFWAWHLIYTILALFLFTPLLVAPLLNGALTDTTPWHYLLYALLIIILPFASMYLGVKYFHRDHGLLMKYFYGFEMPLLFFLLVRVFTFRDDGWAVSWLTLVVTLALLFWLAVLFIQQRDKTETVPLKNDWHGIIGSTLLAGVGIYFGVIFLIIQLPNAVEFIAAVIDVLASITFEDIGELFWMLINPLWWLLGLFLVFTFSLFLALPLVMIYLYIRQFIQRLPSLLTPIRITVVLAIIALNIGVLYFTNQQPQQAVFSLLEQPMPANKQDADIDDLDPRSILMAQHESIRTGLLNAYLARYRYLSTTNSSRRIQHNYQTTFGLSKDAAAIPQHLFNALLKPFLYDGESWNDKERAAKHYAALFDAPIQKAERELIVDTLKHTWEMGADNAAGLLDALNHHVHLEQQQIDIIEQQNVATVTIQQTLRNLTALPKETVLHFSLPEDAALTGVWLSDDEEQPLKYPYVLSPKGAAQAVYKAEVKRRIDPALLEQTGPYQYRLRVYPVPGKPTRKDQAIERLYVRFSYQTLADTQGNWPMPNILEKRNIFWDTDTVYQVNGQNQSHNKLTEAFPTQVARNKTPTVARNWRFNAGGQAILAIQREREKEVLPTNQRFAVLVDGSYSMREHYPAVQKILAVLRQHDIQFDRYFCGTECAPLPSDNAAYKPVFFGNSQPQQQLRAFSKIAHSAQYDAILMLSDTGSYELEVKSNDEALPSTQPLWLVHLSHNLPYAYDDKLLDTLYRSGGGITTSALEALRRYQLFAQGVLPAAIDAPENAQLISVSNQYLWFVTQKTQNTGTTDRPAAVAAAHWLRHLMRTLDTQKIETLDQIHAAAKRDHIVSHYSSMLVLVNDRQKAALKKAEQQDDRFDREVETGKQNATAPKDPFAVPAVPEPEEWALIIIALGLLSYAGWRRRKQFVFPAYNAH